MCKFYIEEDEKILKNVLINIIKVAGRMDTFGLMLPPSLEEGLIASFNRGIIYVILDLSQAIFSGNDTLPMLLKLTDTFRKGGGDILLTNVPNAMLRMFQICELLSFVTIFNDQEQALEFLNGKLE